MYEGSSALYRFRFVFGAIAALAALIIFSLSVTAIGRGSVIDPSSTASATSQTMPQSSSLNAVTSGLNNLGDSLQNTAISVGSATYRFSSSVTSATRASMTAIGHGAMATITGLGKAIAFAAVGSVKVSLAVIKGTGAATIAAIKFPGKIVGTFARSTPTVSTFIQPDENNPVPVIDNKLSPSILAHLKAEMAQEAAAKQANPGLVSGQIAANQALDGQVVAGDPNHGGYPSRWDNARQDSLLDSWGLYNRECVSYAAWKVYQTFGHMPYWGGHGDANQWLANARADGITTSYTPKVHSVAISKHGYYGHAMWVEKVEGDRIYVSQYNYDLTGHYSEMWISSKYLTYIYFQ